MRLTKDEEVFARELTLAKLTNMQLYWLYVLNRNIEDSYLHGDVRKDIRAEKSWGGRDESV